MKPATQRFPQRQPMRRVLASISNTMEIGDVTTLANPEIVEQIRIMVQGEAKVATKAGPQSRQDELNRMVRPLEEIQG